MTAPFINMVFAHFLNTRIASNCANCMRSLKDVSDKLKWTLHVFWLHTLFQCRDDTALAKLCCFLVPVFCSPLASI